MGPKKLSVKELRTLIMEALNEEASEKHEISEDAESAAAEQEMETRASADKEAEETMSESAQLERWKKLAGLLTSQPYMSIPRYGIWYKDSAQSKEVVVGMCHKWLDATKMASDLYTIRKNIDQALEVATGIFLYEPGILYTSAKPRRWQVMPLQTSNT